MTFEFHGSGVFLAVLCFLCIPGAQAKPGDSDYYMGFEAGGLSGDFGTLVDSDLYSFQVVGGLLASNYDVSVSVPYLIQKDDPGYTVEGLGDIALLVGHTLLPKQADGISVDGSVMLKLPTADESKGLGTGEFDIGLILDINHQWPSFSASLRAGFINTGDTAVDSYNNSFLYGVSFFRMDGRFGNYLSLEGRTATIDHVANPLELQIGTFYALNLNYMLTANALIGLSNSSPDLGMSAGFRYWFD